MSCLSDIDQIQVRHDRTRHEHDVLRMGTIGRPPHLDIYASGTYYLSCLSPQRVLGLGTLLVLLPRLLCLDNCDRILPLREQTTLILNLSLFRAYSFQAELDFKSQGPLKPAEAISLAQHSVNSWVLLCR